MSNSAYREFAFNGFEHPAARLNKVFVAGPTGYIGRFVVRELVARGYEVVCFVRQRAGQSLEQSAHQLERELPGCELRFGDITDRDSLLADGFRGEQFGAVVSCLASRSGGIQDSWAIDYGASRQLLDASLGAGVQHFVLLSAICVQKPRLAFQHAKLKMEQALIDSGLSYSIVRPTAFFKSVAGQIEGVRNGKPYLLFKGSEAACSPIGEADLAAFMADCLENKALHNRVLPVGGPDEPMTARQRGELLFQVLGMTPRYRQVPLALFSLLLPVLDLLALVLPTFREKAEFARIGQYYAAESMLMLDRESGQYSAAATPRYGKQTLRDFYEQALANGMAGQELGEHAVFARGQTRA